MAIRKSISIKGLVYQRLKDYCDAKGVSVSGFLEEIIHARMDERNVPVPTSVDVPEPKGPSSEEIEAEAAKHFTF